MTLAAVFYAGWITTLTGKIDHMHHVLWVLAILAVSPCANEWSIRRENRAGSAKWALTAVIVLIGLVYFGAGLQKLLSAGFGWGWSDNLTNWMLYASWEKGVPVRHFLLDWPIVGRVMGVGALLFELSFLPLILHPKTRRLVWPAGLLFHWGTWWMLGIPFLSLQLMYAAFLPFDDPDGQPTDAQRRVIVPVVAVVALFTVMMVEVAYPFAAYPGFEGVRPTEQAIVLADGVPVVESERAGEVGPHRLSIMAGKALAAGRGDEFAAWLGASDLSVTTVDLTLTGQTR